jgi:hypothetical protein
MLKLTLNGRSITSQHQLKRELERSMNAAIESSVRRAAPAGVRIKKTADGFVATGSSDAIARMTKRLSS